MDHQSDYEDESNSVGSHSGSDHDGHALDLLRSAGDQAAGASRVVDSAHPLGLASTGASSGESVPTASTTAGRSSESTVSVSQRPLTRASAAATRSRALPAQGSRRSSPHVPLLQIPPPPREGTTMRANPLDRTMKQCTNSLMVRTSPTQLAVTQSRTKTGMRWTP